MSLLTIKQYYRSKVGLRISIKHPHGWLEGYIISGNKTARKKLKHIDLGAAACGSVANSLGFNRIAYLAYLSIDIEYRSKGYGSQLVAAFIKEAQKKKVDWIFLIAHPESPSEQRSLFRFYRRFSFKLKREYQSLMYRRERP